MNERILELADKAVEDMPSGPWNISDEFCKKFAELIIKECGEIAALGDANYSAQHNIHKHFGVE
jgi:hypothetical protein